MTGSSPDGGGRFLLRLVKTTDQEIEYQGAFEIGTSKIDCTCRVLLPAGTVEVSRADGSVPEWLVDQTRATLRAAFRASGSGAPWPRRIHRYREARTRGDGG